MWTTLSVRICLLTLAVVMLCAAEANFSDLVVPCTCKGKLSSRVIQRFKKCYEQIPRDNCDHAFMFLQGKNWRCIKPDAVWLTEKIKTGNLTCPPDLVLEK